MGAAMPDHEITAQAAVAATAAKLKDATINNAVVIMTMKRDTPIMSL